MYVVKNGVIVTEAVELDGRDEWLVAVDQGSGEKSLFVGSPSDLSPFNALANDVNLRIDTEEDAMKDFNFFREIEESFSTYTGRVGRNGSGKRCTS